MANIQHPWMLVIHILNICKDSIFLFTTLDQCKRKRLCVSECLCVSNWWRYRPRYAFLSFFCWWCHLQNHFPHSIPTSFVIFFFLCDLNLLKRSKSARTGSCSSNTSTLKWNFIESQCTGWTIIFFLIQSFVGLSNHFSFEDDPSKILLGGSGGEVSDNKQCLLVW